MKTISRLTKTTVESMTFSTVKQKKKRKKRENNIEKKRLTRIFALSEDWRDNSVVQSASSGSTGNSEISVLTPAGVPGVLDDPVGSSRAGIGVISDDEESVVERSWVAIIGGGWVDNSAGIIHEEISVHGNGERTSIDEEGGHEGGLISTVGGGQASVVLEGSIVRSGHLASSVLTSVWVGILGLKSSPGHDISHGVPHPATTASRVADGLSLLHAASVRAIDDHLLRELLGSGLVVLDGVGRLEASRGGEGPA